MDFAFSTRVETLRRQLQDFMDAHVVPRHAQWLAEARGGLPVSFMADLKALAHSEGLWNLFLPGLREDEQGTRLSNLEYAPLAEIMGRIPWASEVFNCSAPDTGNMELLHLFATPEQRERWKRGVSVTESLMGEALGRLYVERHFPPQAKARMDELVANLRREIDPDEAYLEAKLAWKLSPQQLAVLRALCAWRERQARARNQPRNRVLREHSLWPLARFQLDNTVALARIEDMHPRTVRQDGETILKLIREAAALPPEQWPEALPMPLPLEAGALLKQLRAVGQREAERLQIAPELMLRKKSLEALLKSGFPDGPWTLPDNLRGWRRELMGQALLDELQ